MSETTNLPITTTTYTWNNAEKQMMKTVFLNNNRRSDLDIIIDLSANKIIQIQQEPPIATLSPADNYTFLDFMQNIRATDDLMEALLGNEYYVETFLSSSMGVFNVPNAPELSSYFFVFSSFLLPYENLYVEIHKKPKYKDRLLKTYDEHHNSILRQVKEILRILLVIPGIFITPFLLIVVLFSYNNMGR
jgi:hypothetical protein